jgi:hypothetical protein
VAKYFTTALIRVESIFRLALRKSKNGAQIQIKDRCQRLIQMVLLFWTLFKFCCSFCLKQSYYQDGERMKRFCMPAFACHQNKNQTGTGVLASIPFQRLVLLGYCCIGQFLYNIGSILTIV